MKQKKKREKKKAATIPGKATLISCAPSVAQLTEEHSMGGEPSHTRRLHVLMSSWTLGGPQLLVRPPRASILSVSAAKTK